MSDFVSDALSEYIKHKKKLEKAGVVFCCVCRYRDTECCKWRSDESPDDDDFCSIGERR
jgi:hypothetical protein